MKNKCSFCLEETQDAELVIGASPNTYICFRCVDVAHGQISETGFYDSFPEHQEVDMDLKPSDIKRELDKSIIGQDSAKIALSIAMYNHFKRINQEKDEVDIQKSNVLMLGGTGSGKSYLAQNLAKAFDLPFVIADVTTLTISGYVGDDVESVLTRLIQDADGDISKAERGVVVLDEIDKLARKGENTSITKDVSSEGVQQALLKLIEGTVVRLPEDGGRKNPNGKMIEIDTSNILFICTGAFPGIEKIIEKRLKSGMSKTIGFTQENDKIVEVKGSISDVRPEDVRNYGMIEEFLGRIPIITYTNQLSEDDLVSILTKPSNAIVKQYQKLFRTDGVDLKFTDGALKSIAEKAIKNKSGARGLRTEIEYALKDTMFEYPDVKDLTKITVDKNVITKGTNPRYD